MELKKFDNFGEPAIRISEKMIETLNNYKIKSVSAPEIAIYEQVIAVRAYPNEPIYVAFNPRIVNYGDATATIDEECFSYPGLKVRITRPYEIRVRFNDPYGNIVTKTFDGAISRLFQHEMTHMNNYIFWNDANFYNKNKAIKNWKILSRKVK